jgi:hypothetical protein
VNTVRERFLFPCRHTIQLCNDDMIFIPSLTKMGQLTSIILMDVMNQKKNRQKQTAPLQGSLGPAFFIGPNKNRKIYCKVELQRG